MTIGHNDELTEGNWQALSYSRKWLDFSVLTGLLCCVYLTSAFWLIDANEMISKVRGVFYVFIFVITPVLYYYSHIRKRLLVVIQTKQVADLLTLCQQRFFLVVWLENQKLRKHGLSFAEQPVEQQLVFFSKLLRKQIDSLFLLALLWGAALSWLMLQIIQAAFEIVITKPYALKFTITSLWLMFNVIMTIIVVTILRRLRYVLRTPVMNLSWLEQVSSLQAHFYQRIAICIVGNTIYFIALSLLIWLWWHHYR